MTGRDVLSSLDDLETVMSEFGHVGTRIDIRRGASVDLLTVTALNRGMNVVAGFCLLLRSRNFHCAAPLVRLQMDSALRLFAVTLVEDAEGLALRLLHGELLRRIKDDAGQWMNDKHLVSKLAPQCPGLSEAYEHACGFIHLSRLHAKTMIRRHEGDATQAQVVIATGDTLVADEDYKSIIGLFRSATNMLLNVASEVISKHRGGA